MPTSSIKFVVHLAFLQFILHVIITLTLQISGEGGGGIMTLLRVRYRWIITRELYTRKFGYEVLGDNIKVFYKQG